jgi:hypothetical protein
MERVEIHSIVRLGPSGCGRRTAVHLCDEAVGDERLDKVDNVGWGVVLALKAARGFINGQSLFEQVYDLYTHGRHSDVRRDLWPTKDVLISLSPSKMVVELDSARRVDAAETANYRETLSHERRPRERKGKPRRPSRLGS